MRNGRRYGINEIFYSVQGEGVRAGSANVFLRFSGCNQTCALETHGFDCDTEFVSSHAMALDEIVARVLAEAGDCRAVVLTGGEPALQLDAALVAALKARGFYLAIETNGSVALPEGIDWITVSPKTAESELRQRRADEVKYVRAHGQPLPETTVEAEHYLLSPAFDADEPSPRNIAWCIELVKEHPRWRLSVQQHKLWNVR